MGQFCRRCNPKQRGPYPNIRANEHKWRPIGSNENMPWVVVTIPDELEKNGQPQNEKMKFESSKHETKLSMKLTAQVQARILSKTHREPANKPERTNKLKRAADGHGGGGDHGGRSAILDSNRRRIVGILCSVLLVVKLGGLLVQVFYFLRSLPLWRTLRVV